MHAEFGTLMVSLGMSLAYISGILSGGFFASTKGCLHRQACALRPLQVKLLGAVSALARSVLLSCFVGMLERMPASLQDVG